MHFFMYGWLYLFNIKLLSPFWKLSSKCFSEVQIVQGEKLVQLGWYLRPTWGKIVKQMTIFIGFFPSYMKKNKNKNKESSPC